MNIPLCNAMRIVMYMLMYSIMQLDQYNYCHNSSGFVSCNPMTMNVTRSALAVDL